MKLFVLALLVLFSGCTQTPEGIKQNTQAAVSPAAAAESCGNLGELERQINALYSGGNVIGSEQYELFKTQLGCFENTTDKTKLNDLLQKLEMLKPDGEKARFSSVQREVNVLYSDKRTIGPEHYDRLAAELAYFEQKGYQLEEIQSLGKKLKTISPYGIQSTSPGNSTTSPAVLRDMETISRFPECAGQKLTAPPADLSEVFEITPLGNINPPGHTLPTPHMYFHINAGGASTRTVELKAPGDIVVFGVGSSYDEIGKIEEYSIGFALCKEVYGYFNHVKGISAGLKAAVDAAPCNDQTVGKGCGKTIFYEAKAGTMLGKVGHLQGNFDFGTYDYRTKLAYANPASYGDLSAAGFGRPKLLSVTCPLELYEEPVKSQLYSEIKRTAEPRCGQVMQDVKGTLQGSWFHEGGRADLAWEKHLSFVYGNLNPSTAVIAVAGIISQPIRREFTPSTTGFIDRNFADVKPDGNLYCYDAGSGRLVLQLTSETELKIEKQDGSCSGSYKFSNATIYRR